ncbi:MAG: glycoside hydrolase family 130 protein [Verrucomicrobiota bacterium JB024]|nr:glycoside hydrolase family 130 protein [Verrucomicrobiota bacterium JB024]
MSVLKRYEGNPIFSPENLPGEVNAVFNCGQIMHGDTTILLVPLVYEGERPHMRVAESKDGINFTLRDERFIEQSSEPHMQGLDIHAIDPRVTYFKEDGCYYIIRPGGGTKKAGPISILGKTKDWKTYEEIEIVALPSNRVPCLFPEKINGLYCRLDRCYDNFKQTAEVAHIPTRGHMWISYSPDLIHWGQHRFLLESYAQWNSHKLGPTPPIKTDKGWLVIIHGVEHIDNSEGKFNWPYKYHLGAVLLNLEDPRQIIGKTAEPILSPEEDYEIFGRTDNVVFACGAIADHDQDRLRIYYGAADTRIGLATGSLSEIIALCK